MSKSTIGALIALWTGLSAACGSHEPPPQPDGPPSAELGAAKPSEPSPRALESSPPAQTEAPATDPPPDSTSDASAGSEREPDVVYVPTPQPVVDKMLELAKVKKTDVVYDLGCGDGRIVITAAKKYGTKAWGFDIDPERVAEARENVKNSKVEHLVTIEQKDIFTLDLSPASVVTLYLLPELNVRLIPQLEKLKPGSRIVSHDFDMEGVKPLKHLSLKLGGEDGDHEVYLWHTPLQKIAKP